MSPLIIFQFVPKLRYIKTAVNPRSGKEIANYVFWMPNLEQLSYSVQVVSAMVRIPLLLQYKFRDEMKWQARLEQSIYTIDY